MKWSFARSSEEAKVLGRALLLEGHIKMVNMHTLERSGSFSCHSIDRGNIVDSHSQFYIFVGSPIHPSTAPSSPPVASLLQALFAPPKQLELFQEASDSDSDETEQPPCLMVNGRGTSSRWGTQHCNESLLCCAGAGEQRGQCGEAGISASKGRQWVHGRV